MLRSVTFAFPITLAALAADPATAQTLLEPIGSRTLAAPAEGLLEPSGLARDPGGKGLWIVDDDARKVFLLSEEDGGGLTSFPFDHEDLEGIAPDPLEAGLLAVLEGEYALVRFDPVGAAEHASISLRDMAEFDQFAPMFGDFDDDDGLEGITTDPGTGQVYIAKEAKPRLLIRLAPNLDRIETVWVLSEERGFHVDDVKDKKLDIAGLSFDAPRRAIWMVSDTGRAVFLFDLVSQRARQIPIRASDGDGLPNIDDMEGIALSAGGDRVLIVTDDGNNGGENSRLLTFAIR